MWRSYVEEWDRSQRAANNPHSTRYNYELAVVQLAEFLAGDELPAFLAKAGATASAQVHRDRQSFAYLAEARDLAPDWVRYQPLGKAVMQGLVERAARRFGAQLAQLAAHYNVIP
jgi:hypothetical protein